MRIIHINTINQVANMHARGLNALGYTSTVYQPNVRGGLAPLPVKMALMPVRLLDLLATSQRLTKRNYDLAHIHWAAYGMLGRLGHIPYVVQCHGSDVRDRISSRIHRPLLQQIFSHASAVLCTTPDLLSVVRQARPDASYMPGPIDTDQFQPGPGARGRPWTIFLFTRLEPGKRVDLAMEGIERFAQRHPDTRIRLLDWGELADIYRQRYSARFGERIEFIPRVEPSKVQFLLHDADVVVGQFGIGALTLSDMQAMSCGLPVIMSFRYADEYSNPPPLLNASTPAEVEDRLEFLYRTPEHREYLGPRARQWVIEQHGIPAVAARLDMLYRTILRGEPRRAD
jgi:glycosyltransferase involved in cell wall biosynthesis